MATGKVKWFNASKGFGFNAVDDGSEAFVHQNDIQGEGPKSLAEGETVIERAECIADSFPGFAELMQGLRERKTGLRSMPHEG